MPYIAYTPVAQVAPFALAARPAMRSMPMVQIMGQPIQNNGNGYAFGTFYSPYSQLYPNYNYNPQLTGISARQTPNFVTPFQNVLNDKLPELNFNNPYQQLTVPTIFQKQLAGLNGPSLSSQQLQALFPGAIDLSSLNPYAEPTGKFTQVVPFTTPGSKDGTQFQALDYLNIAENFQANVYPNFRIGSFIQ